ncbi:hypothetical protein EMIT0P44_50074 [Pseudomonas sp. IT-P44]
MTFNFSRASVTCAKFRYLSILVGDQVSLNPDALNAVTGAYFSSAYATNALAICMMSGFRWSAAQSIVIASPPSYHVHAGRRVSTYFG